MAKVKIEGNASGTGTFTIAAPNSNTDRTLTLPDEAGTVLTSASDIQSQALGDIPVFDVWLNGFQTLTNNTYTKLQFDTVVFDTHSFFDLANNRYTPTIAGYYDIGLMYRADDGATTSIEVAMYKNGSVYRRVIENTNISSQGYLRMMSASYLVYLNGSTDYVEFYIAQQSAATADYGYNAIPYANHMFGRLVRA